jgi:hypothetical protein
MLFPLAVDGWLWAGPRFSPSVLIRRLVALWEALIRATYSSDQLDAMGELLAYVPETLERFGASSNLADFITGSWLGTPSLIAVGSGSRLTFLSDLIMTPFGLGLSIPAVAAAPWRSQVEVTSLWGVLLSACLFWIAGQALLVVFLRLASLGRSGSSVSEALGASRWNGMRGFFALAWRVVAFSVVLWLVVWVLRLPIGVMATFLLISGGSVAGVLFALVGGITLWLLAWFLISFFFVGEGLLLDGQTLWRSILQSVALVRFNGVASIGLATVVNLILLGFRAVWGLVGQQPLGAVIGMLGNAFLVTAMMLAVFAYYESLRDRWLVEAEALADRLRPPAP